MTVVILTMHYLGNLPGDSVDLDADTATYLVRQGTAKLPGQNPTPPRIGRYHGVYDSGPSTQTDPLPGDFSNTKTGEWWTYTATGWVNLGAISGGLTQGAADARYALLGHNHDASYSLLNHAHSAYSLTSHNHDTAYSGLSHTHSAYSLTTHTHTTFVPIPSSAIPDDYIPKKTGGAAPSIVWTTSSEQVARGLGWIVITDPQWAGGAIAGQDSTAAIQAAHDAADKWNQSTGAYLAGGRGKTVYTPPDYNDYILKKSIVSNARIQQRGASGASYGGVASTYRCDPTGDFTNTNAPTGQGLDPGKAWAMRLSRNSIATYDWWHGGSIEGIQFDLAGVPGLGGVIGLGAGELSLVERVQIINSGVTPRTSTQATFNGTATVVVPDGAFDALEDFQGRVTSPQFPTYADLPLTVSTTAGSPVATVTTGSVAATYKGAGIVGGTSSFRGLSYVQSVDSTTQITMTRPAEGTATGVPLTLGQPRDFRIIRIDSATQVTLDRPVPYTGTGSLTINRPRPGMRWHGGAATGVIRSLNVSGNSGAGLEYVNGAGNSLESITGDNNGGPLIRFHACGQNGDTDSIVINSFKAENNNYGDTSALRLENWGDHDPVIALTACGMLNVEIKGGKAYAGDFGTTDLIRIQQSGPWQMGYPSLTVAGIEADNPWNVRFENLIRDLDSGKAIPAGGIYTPTFGGRFYPTVEWNKDHRTLGDLYVDEVPYSGYAGYGGNLIVRGQQVAAGRPAAYEWAWDTPPDVETRGAWNPSSSGGQYHRYGWAWPTGGDLSSDREWRWNVPVGPGTSKLWVAYTKRQDFAILTWEISFDGGANWTALGTLDTYVANATLDQATAYRGYIGAGVTVPRAGPAILRVRNPTRNAANTTGYYWGISIVRFWTV